MDKVCRDCGETKPIAEFFKSPRNAGGYAPRCKPCYMIQQAGYRKKPPREETPPGTKRCWMCKTIKPSADFSANKDFHDGLNRGCRACTNARSATYDLANRESLNAKQLARYYADPLRYADYGLKKRFGLPMGSYDRMLAEQGNCCAICGATEPGGRTKRFHVDHCHATGRVRSLLCENCNNGLGRFRDKPHLLRAAADYLEKHHK